MDWRCGNTKKSLGQEELTTATIKIDKLEYGHHEMKCYVYSTDNKRFSSFSDVFSQVLEPPNHLTETFNAQVHVSEQNGTAGTIHTFNATNGNQPKIGDGLIVFGFAAGTVNNAATLINLTIYIPNQGSPRGTISNPIPHVSQHGAVNGSELASFYSFDNAGSGDTTCDVIASFSGNVDYSSITTSTLTGSTNAKAFRTNGDSSANSSQPVPPRGPFEIDVPAGGVAFVLAGSGNGPLAPANWLGVTENCHEQTVTANFRPYYFGSV